MGAHRQTLLLAALLVALIGAGACDVVKSESPLSPSVAGPIAGVNITAPTPVQPSNGQSFKPKDQPITLVFQNAGSNGVRPLYYRLELAADSAFSSVMFTNPSVAQGSGGQTSLRLPDALAVDHTYYWRVRAEDGANTGPYADARNFTVLAPVVINPPVPVDPIGGAKVTTTSPALTVTNATRTGPAGAISYRFEVATDFGFATLVGAATVSESAGRTTWTATGISYNKTYYWRVQASDPDTTSSWSAVESFVVGAAPTAPTPGGSCGPPYPSTPLAIVQCRRAQYGTPMSSSQQLDFEKKVAKDLNAAGIADGPFGILRKPGGTSCGGYACDIMCSGQGTSQKQWDILYDSDNLAVATWNGPATYPNIRVDVCDIQ